MKIITTHSIFFILSFILFTIIGTISHEYGHIVVAEYLGYDTILHYGSMSWDRDEEVNKLIQIKTQFFDEIQNDRPFEQRSDYEESIKKMNRHSLLISLGGPIQTMLFGTLGIFLALYLKKKRANFCSNFLDWFSIFLALFWLRQIFNLSMSVLRGIILQNGIYFGGDEAKISNLLDLKTGTVPILLGIMGLILVCYTIFSIMPEKFRFTFILSGLIGGFLGFLIWMKFLGPLLLP